MIVTIQLRRDTAANWTLANSVLHQGELGLETDTGKIKIGDGVTAWSSLSYFASGTVASVFGRTGAIVAQAGDYTASQVTGAVQVAGDIGGTAASPQVTGTHLAAPLPIAQGGTGTATGAPQNNFFAGPATGGTGAPLFRSLTASDFPGALRPWQFSVDDPAYAAKGDGKVVVDVSTTSGSKVITSATAAFTAADVGKTVMINGGNGTLTGPYVDVIASVQSATQATLTTNTAGATASNCAMVWGTDDTAAIKSALNAAGTYAQANGWFAEILFGAKIYIIAGTPVQTSGAGGQVNAQLPIPYPSVNGLSRKLVISLKGVGNAGQTQYWESTFPNLQGTCLVSTQTAPSTPSPTFGQQSVVGGPSAGGAFTGSFANTKVVIDGITVWHPMYTNMYAYDFGYVASMEWGSFSSQAFAPTANLSAASVAHPYQSDMPLVTTTIGVGCRFPLVGNNDDVCGTSFAAQGIDLPLIMADHFTCLRVASVYFDAAGKIDLTHGTSGSAHAVTIGQWSVEGGNGGLTTDGGGGSYVSVYIIMDTELASPAYDVNDPSNCMHGMVRICDNGVGRVSRLPIITGGANLQVVNDMLGPGFWSGAPAAPASGASQQNTSWRPAKITVTSTAAITAFSVDGNTVFSGSVSSGQPVTIDVPAGHSYVVTSAGGTLTTHWVLN